MARAGWFDEKGSDVRKEEAIQSLQSWREAAHDGEITLEELTAQQQRIFDMLKEIESKVPDELHEELRKIILEFEVLVMMAENIF